MAFDKNKFRNIYPFESRFHEVRKNLRMHFVDEGQGEVLIAVHGNPTWSFFFRRLISALRTSHRVIAPDHIGCGLSDKPSDELYQYRLKNRIEDLETLISHLAPNDPLTLVLHDWGGAIGMGFAARHPDRIRRLILFNTAAFPLPSARAFPWQLRLFRDSTLGETAQLHLNAFCLTAAVTCSIKGLAPLVREGFLAPYDSPGNRIAIARFVQDIPLQPSDPSYSTLLHTEQMLNAFQNIPALICWGRKDFIFDRSFFNEWKKRLPNAECHSYGDAGHYLLEDAPDRILPAVSEFLQNHPVF